MSAALDFEAAQQYLLGTISESVSPRTEYKLDRIAEFLRVLGDPHRAYPCVHVGGTSGKGSTATMIAAALQAGGTRTGLHTKPHLRSMTERARVDGLPVSEERFAQLLGEMMPAIETIAARWGPPTYYETLLALSLLHFARERVGAAVVEVGLGGRLDGTNVLLPEVAVITSVGLDHTDVLGETLEAIAWEKAGIAKPGVPLVVGRLPAAAMRVVERTAFEAGAPVTLVEAAATVENVRAGSEGQSFGVVTQRARYVLHTPVLGSFQRDNASTAIAALEQLPVPLRPSVAAVEAAFAALVIPGRMEVAGGRPAVVYDIAHNAEKAARLADALRERFGPQRRMHYVVAIGETKDAREIVRALAALPSRFTFTAFSASGRSAIDPRRLAAIASELGIESVVAADPQRALESARHEAGDDGVVVVTGSTFVVAQLRQCRTPTAAAR